MTREELVTHIERGIEHTGGAMVPIGIIQEVFSANTRISPTIDTELKKFASNHGWSVRNDDAVPTHRIIFSHASGVAEC